jgi:hypothetical protein
MCFPIPRGDKPRPEERIVRLALIAQGGNPAQGNALHDVGQILIPGGKELAHKLGGSFVINRP